MLSNTTSPKPGGGLEDKEAAKAGGSLLSNHLLNGVSPNTEYKEGKEDDDSGSWILVSGGGASEAQPTMLTPAQAVKVSQIFDEHFRQVYDLLPDSDKKESKYGDKIPFDLPVGQFTLLGDKLWKLSNKDTYLSGLAKENYVDTTIRCMYELMRVVQKTGLLSKPDWSDDIIKTSINQAGYAADLTKPLETAKSMSTLWCYAHYLDRLDNSFLPHIVDEKTAQLARIIDNLLHNLRNYPLAQNHQIVPKRAIIANRLLEFGLKVDFEKIFQEISNGLDQYDEEPNEDKLHLLYKRFELYQSILMNNSNTSEFKGIDINKKEKIKQMERMSNKFSSMMMSIQTRIIERRQKLLSQQEESKQLQPVITATAASVGQSSLASELKVSLQNVGTNPPNSLGDVKQALSSSSTEVTRFGGLFGTFTRWMFPDEKMRKFAGSPVKPEKAMQKIQDQKAIAEQNADLTIIFSLISSREEKATAVSRLAKNQNYENVISAYFDSIKQTISMQRLFDLIEENSNLLRRANAPLSDEQKIYKKIGTIAAIEALTRYRNDREELKEVSGSEYIGFWASLFKSSSRSATTKISTSDKCISLLNGENTIFNEDELKAKSIRGDRLTHIISKSEYLITLNSQDAKHPARRR